MDIEWYGDPDHRSYRVDFKKIEALGYRATRVVEDGVREICEEIESGRLEKTNVNITLKHYQDLEYWFKVVKDTELHGGMLHI